MTLNSFIIYAGLLCLKPKTDRSTSGWSASGNPAVCTLTHTLTARTQAALMSRTDRLRLIAG